MTLDCHCRCIVTAQFARAIELLEKQLTENPDTQRRDANRVFHTAKKIAADDARAAEAAEHAALVAAGRPTPAFHSCVTSKKCCGGCLPTVERMLQSRGYHSGEKLDTGADPSFMEDVCPFPMELAPAPGG